MTASYLANPPTSRVGSKAITTSEPGEYYAEYSADAATSASASWDSNICNDLPASTLLFENVISNQSDISASTLQACASAHQKQVKTQSERQKQVQVLDRHFEHKATDELSDSEDEIVYAVGQGGPTKKKYKPVAKKVRPIGTTMPNEFRIVRRIPSDPLIGMRDMPTRPPEWEPSPYITRERLDGFKIGEGDFLWPEEVKLVKWIIMQHEKVFAWKEAERRRFRSDYLPPVKIPTVPHTPWVRRHLPIPPAVRTELMKLLYDKIKAGVYEESNSSYRASWFCVTKKDGKSLRIVHDLQPLNAVTIRDSGGLPTPDEFSEECTGFTCLSALDQYSSYDLQLLHEDSRDLTTFQTPLGTLRNVTLPMGWTNSVAVQQGNLVHLLAPVKDNKAAPFVDDVMVKGTRTYYRTSEGGYETIPQNPGIRRFVWESAQTLHEVLRRLDKAGASIGGKKAAMLVPQTTVVGYQCSFEGRKAEERTVQAVKNWHTCKNVSEVRAFLGTAGVARTFIKGFSQLAKPLVELVKKQVPWTWGQEQMDAMEALKEAVINAPCLKPIDYSCEREIILAVDSSYLGVGFILLQIGEDSRRYTARFGSINWNEREQRYSQSKIELYGLYRALRAMRLHIYGAKRLVVEVDAKYIKGMLNNPDEQPNATINRWIAAALLFDFELRHVPGEKYTGADGLSRRPYQDGDEIEEDDHEDWIDHHLGLSVLEAENPVYPSEYPTVTREGRLCRNQWTLAVTRAIQKARGGKLRDLIKEQEADEDNSDVSDASDEDDDEPGIQRRAGDDEEASAEDESDEEAPFTRNNSAQRKMREADLEQIREFWKTRKQPSGLGKRQEKRFIKRAAIFFMDEKGALFRKAPNGQHQLVVFEPRKRMKLLRQAHDELGHKGVLATRQKLATRFWWPYLSEDIQWYIRSCDQCQRWQNVILKVPPTVAPAPKLFQKVYADSMHMPRMANKKYIVHMRCGLSMWPEWRALGKESGAAIGKFIFEDILCRWGAVAEIVTDNGTPFVAALDWLRDRYKITHIRISPYNSPANGAIERRHYDTRQAIMKTAEEVKFWNNVVWAVFWAERITLSRVTAMTPYYASHGVEPLLPFDLTEATFGSDAWTANMSTEDLIAERAKLLLKRPEELEAIRHRVEQSRYKSAEEFEKRYQKQMQYYEHNPGEMVLVRNSAVDKELVRKVKPRFNGPYIVVRRTKGGSYVIAELDNTIALLRVAAFRLLPYYPRRGIAYELPKEVVEEAERMITYPDPTRDDDSGDPGAPEETQ